MRAGPIYVIDTSSIMDLHGFNPATCLTTNAAIRERVWKGLEDLIDLGRLVTVYAVQDELKRNAPECYSRLKPRMKKLIQRDTAALWVAAGAIIDAHPSLIRHLDRKDNSREPADPYVIAYAQLNPSVSVVTNEKHKNQRASRRGERIPDVCDGMNLKWLSLAQLVNVERL